MYVQGSLAVTGKKVTRKLLKAKSSKRGGHHQLQKKVEMSVLHDIICDVFFVFVELLYFPFSAASLISLLFVVITVQ